MYAHHAHIHVDRKSNYTLFIIAKSSSFLIQTKLQFIPEITLNAFCYS